MTTAERDVLEGGAREAFRRIGLGERKGYRLAADGKLPFLIRVGGTYIVPRRAFERYLAGDLRADSNGNKEGA